MKTAYAEKVSYLKGLADGMDLDKETKEGKILLGIIDALKEISDALDELSDEHRELEEYVSSIDEDLADLESDYYEEDDYAEVECPKCGEVICIDSDLADDEETLELVCPNCGEIICYDEEGDIFDEDDAAFTAVTDTDGKNVKDNEGPRPKLRAVSPQTPEGSSSKPEKDAERGGGKNADTKEGKGKKKS